MAVEDQLLRDVEEVEPEVHQGAEGRFAVDQQVAFLHVPAAGAGHHDGERRIGAEAVFLAFGGRVAQGAVRGIAQVQNGVNDVGPGGGAGVLQVGKPHLGARVERIDGHLGRGSRARHLNPAVLQGRRCGRNFPVAVAHVLGLRQEIQAAGPGDMLALGGAGLEQLGAGAGETFVELFNEREGLGGEDLLRTLDRPGVCDCDSHCGSFPGLRIRRWRGLLLCLQLQLHVLLLPLCPPSLPVTCERRLRRGLRRPLRPRHRLPRGGRRRWG